MEFSLLQDPDESVDLLDRHPNLVLLRTFSKVYGLCGLRVGYALGSEALPARRGPRAPALLGQRARPGRGRGGAQPRRRGRAPHRAERDRAHARGDRARSERGLETTESQANFSWVALGDRDEDAIVDGLAQRGVIVRAGARARRARPDARDLRHAERERPLPGGAGRAALGALLRIGEAKSPIGSIVASSQGCTASDRRDRPGRGALGRRRTLDPVRLRASGPGCRRGGGAWEGSAPGGGVRVAAVMTSMHSRRPPPRRRGPAS